MIQINAVNLCALTILAGLTIYVLLGGADFGGGVWDLFATGPRRRQQRHAIEHAMGPVWEANHVWLIFVIVLLFTCFPRGFRVLCIALYSPLHLTLVGIIMRGAAFVFRKYGALDIPKHPNWHLPNIGSRRAWGLVFGISSVISPFLLGACFGAVTSGALRVDAAGTVSYEPLNVIPWLTPYSIGCGLLALSTCSYLAAVYLTVETGGDVRGDFRRRAIYSGTATAVLSGIVVILARREAPWFAGRLLSPHASPILSLGLILFAASAYAVFRKHYVASCVCAISEVITLLAGWGVAHRDFLIYPDVTLQSAASPTATLRFVLWSTLAGLALLLPSLWLLYFVFKHEYVAKRKPPEFSSD
jgi:cytochrome bd ubiquinol oxidase subunit II